MRSFALAKPQYSFVPCDSHVIFPVSASDLTMHSGQVPTVMYLVIQLRAPPNVEVRCHAGAIYTFCCPNLSLVCDITASHLALGLQYTFAARQRRCVSVASESTTTKKTFNALNYIAVLASIYTCKFDYYRNMPNR